MDQRTFTIERIPEKEASPEQLQALVKVRQMIVDAVSEKVQKDKNRLRPKNDQPKSVERDR